MRKRIAIAGAVIGTGAGITISRTVRWWRTWGVDPIEAAKALPGDELVPTPTAIDTRAITIDAPPDAVWPWLVQMGFDRAGWYSYDQLDMRGKSVNRLVPEWQPIEVGDVMPTHPSGGFAVRVVEPDRALALYLDTALVSSQADAAASAVRTDLPAGLAASGAMLRSTPTDFAASWAFVLEPLEGGRTRFVERFRVRFGAGTPAFRVISPAMGFGVFVMMQRQMLGIRERAERTAVASRREASPMAPPPPAPAPAPSRANGHAEEHAAETEMVATAT